jgi:transposase
MRINSSPRKNYKTSVYIHSTLEGAECPHCHQPILTPHGVGSERQLRHLSIFGYDTELVITPQRYSCPTCDGHPTTTQRLPWYDPLSTLTCAFETTILRSLINSTIEDASRKEGVSAEKIEGILNRDVATEVDWDKIVSIPVLGLDEISLTKGHGNFVVIVSAVIDNELTILGILKDRKRETVEAFLRTMPKRLKRTVRVVCSDLYSGFIGAAKAVFGKSVAICADRFHVARLYRDAVDDLRKKELRELKKKLSKDEYSKLKNAHWILRKAEADLTSDERRTRSLIFRHSSDLEAAYRLSQALTDVFEAPLTKGQAKRKIRGWIQRVRNAKVSCFNTFIKTMDRHWEEITNYFIERCNSGFVEGLNNKIKVLKRRCYGLKNLKRLYQRVYLDLNGYRLFPR